jgi:hypothetical protein
MLRRIAESADHAISLDVLGVAFTDFASLDQGHPPIALAFAAVLVSTRAMEAGGTKPERPWISAGVIGRIQVQRTAARLVIPVLGCRPGGFLYGKRT